MKYDSQKAFPYPILSDDKEYNDDYPKHDFQASATLQATEDGARAVLTARFEITEETILKCIKDKTATYGVHVLCPKTNYRQLICTQETEFEHSFERGELHGQVTLMGCIVSTEPITDYHSNHLHKDWSEQKCNMPHGGVLAIATPDTYYVEPDVNRPLMSVFELMEDPSIKKEFRYDVDGECITIKMNKAELDRFNAARQDSSTQKFVIMGVYYPIVVEVLRIMASRDGRMHQNRKWYRAIQRRLEHFGMFDKLNEGDAFLYAQKLMEYPLTSLPLGD